MTEKGHDLIKSLANKTAAETTSLTQITSIATISNGLCRFNPTSPKGKWIFLFQTIFLSFTPIMILLIQNGFMFNEMLMRKDMVLLNQSDSFLLAFTPGCYRQAMPDQQYIKLTGADPIDSQGRTVQCH